MPIYEYECPTCGTFEEMQKLSDPALKTCPKGHGGVERKISASGFILKGSGWYVTDYARKSEGSGKGDASKGDASKGDGSKGDASKRDASKGDAQKAKAEPSASGDARPPAASQPAQASKPAPTGNGS